MFRQLLTGLIGCVLMALQAAHAQDNFEMVSLTSADVPPAATPQYSDAQAAVTPDGRFVVFEGKYGGLVTSPTSSFLSDSYSQIYLRDRKLGTTELISQSTAGVVANTTDNDGPTISNDGCRVVFESDATNLIDNHDFSSNPKRHVFLRDRCAPGGPKTTLVDVLPDDSPGLEQAKQPRISGDGRTVVFTSYSDDLVAGLLAPGGGTCTGNPGYLVVYYRRLDLNTTKALTRPDGGCIEGASPDVSYDGSRIAFYSEKDLLNTNPQKWQIYLFDTNIGPRSLSYVSAAANGVPQRYVAGVPGEGYTGLVAPAISQNGRYVAFRSSVYGLWPSELPVQGGTLVNQVFVKDTYTGAIDIASVDSTGTVFGNRDSSSNGRPGLSADGQYIVFRTEATNIAAETGSLFVFHNNFFRGTRGFSNIETSGYPALSPSGRFLTIHAGNALDTRFPTTRGMFLLDLGKPYAPTVTKLTAMGNKMKVDFVPSTIDGAITVNQYVAQCEDYNVSTGTSSRTSNGISNVGTGSPLVVTGLRPGLTYRCLVLASSDATGDLAFSDMVTKKLGADLTPILMLLLD